MTPILDNERHERFAQGIVSGLSGTQSWLSVAPTTTPQAAGVTANRLLKDARVLARIDELSAPAVAALEASAGTATSLKERVLREYERIAFADMRRFASVTAGGISLESSEDWTDDDAAAVAELGETTSKEGGSLRFKLHSKTAALDALAKHLGLFPRETAVIDQSQHVHLPEGLTVEELRRLASGG